MKQKAKLSVIGAFVVVGLFLVVGMVITYGAGEYFKEKKHYILYFEDSVKGLDVGAAVRFLGVKIGRVKKVELLFDAKNLAFVTPVTIEVEEDRVGLVDYDAETRKHLMTMSEEIYREKLLQKGVRAQLKIESLLTGKLFVDIGLHPDAPLTYRDTSGQLEEIPTVLSDIAEFSKAIEKLPVEALVDRVISAVESVERLVNSVQDTGTLTHMNTALKEMMLLAGEARKTLGPLAGSIGEAATETKALAERSEREIGETLKAFKQAADSIEEVMLRAETTLKSFEGMVGDDSPTTWRLNTMMEDVSGAARAIRALADYLERHPESLVFGKE